MGRMLIQSAVDFNVNIAVLDPDPNAPCKNLVGDFSVGKLTDYDTVIEFGKHCDVITIEIENVSTQALYALQEQGKKVFPQPEVIELIQNKVKQKRFYKENNIPTAPFVETQNKAEVAQQSAMIPIVNKLATEGYDGRGVQMIRTEEDLDKAFDKPGMVEELIDFDKEISVIVARNESGDITTFPVVEMVFHPEHNLVEYLFSPADIAQDIAQKATDIAKEVIQKLNMVGLLAVEMFVTKEGEVLVNEIAPRPHNSGHQTIEANYTSQYEQHLRSILNWPLGSTRTLIPSAMVNILGEDGHTGEAKYDGMEEMLAMEGVHIHLYGKKLTKPFRKMGHVTVTGKDIDELKTKVKAVKENLKVIS